MLDPGYWCRASSIQHPAFAFMELHITEHKEGVTIECRVTPRAKKDAVKGIREGALAIALNAPPLEGRANDALIAYLARLLALPRSRLRINRGEKSRNKLVFIEEMRKSALLARLKPHLPPERA